MDYNKNFGFNQIYCLKSCIIFLQCTDLYNLYLQASTTNIVASSTWSTRQKFLNSIKNPCNDKKIIYEPILIITIQNQDIFRSALQSKVGYWNHLRIHVLV